MWQQRSTPVQYWNRISYTREKRYLKCFAETKRWYLHIKTTKLLQDCLTDYLEASKRKYYSSRLTSSKVYWLLLKSILNDAKNDFITSLFTTNLVIIDLKKKQIFLIKTTREFLIQRSTSTISYLQSIFHKKILVKLFQI